VKSLGTSEGRSVSDAPNRLSTSSKSRGSSSLMGACLNRKGSSVEGRLSDGVVFFVLQLLSSFAGLIVTGFLARCVPQTELYLLPVALTFAQLTGVLSSLGLNTVGVRLLPQLVAADRVEEAGSLSRTILLTQLLITSLLTIVIALRADVVAQVFLKQSEASQHVILLLPTAYLTGLSTTVSMMMQAAGKIRALGLIQLSATLLQHLTTVPAYSIAGMPGILLISLPAALMVQIVFSLICLGTIVTRGSFRSFYSPQIILRHAIPFYGQGIVRYMGVEGDLFLITLLLNPTQVATYYVARRLSQFLYRLIGALFSSAIPQFGQAEVRGRDAWNQLFTLVTRYHISLIAIPASVAVASLASPIVMLVGGRDYERAGVVLAIQSLSMISFSIYSLYAMLVLYGLSPICIFYVEAANGFTTFVGGYLVGRHFGAEGIAFGSLLGYTVASLLAARMVLRFMDPVADLRAIYLSVTSALAMAAVLMIPQVLKLPAYMVWACLIPGISIYLALLLLRLPDSQRAQLIDLFPNEIQRFFRQRTAPASAGCCPRTEYDDRRTI